MVVMKFGGSSLVSPASIERVASLVDAQDRQALTEGEPGEEPPEHPVVVVSAIGDTTDHLLEILEHASRAESYAAWKLQEELKSVHFCIAEDLLSPERLRPIDQYIRETFRDLHVRMGEVCEGECSVTPELRAWVASLGEQLSSRIVAAAFEERGIPAKHLDATKLILTESQFPSASPRYWETYARIRWAIPVEARQYVVVMGGFIGATEDGRTTTLGRGGSDLSASLIGAALNASEIQVWKDVDGMLTWDPRVRNNGYRVKRLCYGEARELARSGATILHPETIEPARRLRIPVVIRNTFRPECGGTRIEFSNGVFTPIVKSIACLLNTTVLEVRSAENDPITPEEWLALNQISDERRPLELLAVGKDAIFLTADGDRRTFSRRFEWGNCTRVKTHVNQAIVTVVAEHLRASDVLARLHSTLDARGATILPQENGSCGVRIMLPQREFPGLADAVDRAFFAHIDPAFFAIGEGVRTPEQAGAFDETEAGLGSRPSHPHPLRFPIPAHVSI